MPSSRLLQLPLKCTCYTLKVYTSIPRHPSSLHPFVLFTTGRIFPLPWLFSLYSHSISCSPLYSLTVCYSPFSHRCTGHAQSALILSTLSYSQQKPYSQPYHGDAISMVSLLYPLHTGRSSRNFEPILLLVSNPQIFN